MRSNHILILTLTIALLLGGCVEVQRTEKVDEHWTPSSKESQIFGEKELTLPSRSLTMHEWITILGYHVVTKSDQAQKLSGAILSEVKKDPKGFKRYCSDVIFLTEFFVAEGDKCLLAYNNKLEGYQQQILDMDGKGYSAMKKINTLNYISNQVKRITAERDLVKAMVNQPDLVEALVTGDPEKKIALPLKNLTHNGRKYVGIADYFNTLRMAGAGCSTLMGQLQPVTGD